MITPRVRVTLEEGTDTNSMQGKAAAFVRLRIQTIDLVPGNAVLPGGLCNSAAPKFGGTQEKGNEARQRFLVIVARERAVRGKGTMNIDMLP